MKRVYRSRQSKNPHQHGENEKKGTAFFSEEKHTPFFNAGIQTKLAVGKLGDKYEKEADAMADVVVNNSAANPIIQNKKISNVQRASLATPQEDEKLGMTEQRMEEDKLVQEKPEIQKQEIPEEEKDGIIKKMESEEEEEPLQTKFITSAQPAAKNLPQQLKSKSCKGKSLSKSTKAEMEASFGMDFSQVNIHTNEEAVEMNKELNAQAFTYGSDVYFNSGKYDPGSAKGKHLLAHELTHVVQQNVGFNNSIQKQHDPGGLIILRKEPICGVDPSIPVLNFPSRLTI